MAINFMGSVVGGLLLQNVDMTQMTGMAIFGIYSICVYGIGIAGIVLFFISWSRMKAVQGQSVIEKGNWFRTAIMNPGMLLYCVAMIGVMIIQAFVM